MPPIPSNPRLVNPVRMSYGRCSCQPDFFDAFYERFLQSSPVVAPMFAKTDVKQQKTLLRSSISFLLMYAEGDELARRKVEQLAEAHSQIRRNVRPEYYELWLESLMKTVAQYDREFSPALDAGWRRALRSGIDKMVAGYWTHGGPERAAVSPLPARR